MDEAFRQSVHAENTGDLFNMNALIPGTPFMERLDAHLLFLIRYNMAYVFEWQELKVTYSGSSVWHGMSTVKNETVYLRIIHRRRRFVQDLQRDALHAPGKNSDRGAHARGVYNAARCSFARVGHEGAIRLPRQRQTLSAAVVLSLSQTLRFLYGNLVEGEMRRLLGTDSRRKISSSST